MVLPKKPREVVQMWLEALNRADSDMLAGFYAKDAIYLQMNGEQSEGRAAIQVVFTRHFEKDRLTRMADNFLEDGEWVVLEWHDPQGGRGCSVFHVPYGRIAIQRDYGAASPSPLTNGTEKHALRRRPSP